MNTNSALAISEKIQISTLPHKNVPECLCATNLEQVESAWRLVYNRYSKMGLIDENPHGLHTTAKAIGDHTCVILGQINLETSYTMTLFCDNPMGLALDGVYAPYLNNLRAKGHRLAEVGMLADRRESESRGMNALFSMMRWAIYYGLHHDLTDIVIGVHPRHADFYIRCYGFEQVAPPVNYALVKNNPVVLLRLELNEIFKKDILPRGLSNALANPVALDAFSNRFLFEPEKLSDSLIESFLKAKQA